MTWRRPREFGASVTDRVVISEVDPAFANTPDVRFTNPIPVSGGGTGVGDGLTVAEGVGVGVGDGDGEGPFAPADVPPIAGATANSATTTMIVPTLRIASSSRVDRRTGQTGGPHTGRSARMSPVFAENAFA
jgi:hypothetical protein